MTLYGGLDLLDGDGLRPDMVLRIEDGRITDIRPRAETDNATSLAADSIRAVICPGLIDLQVNGGSGLMLGDCDTLADLKTLTDAHAPSGTLGILPTLISDRPETTARIIALVAEAAKTNPAILGLHLEGPHLAVAGAHDPTVLRPMTEADLALYLDAAIRLPHLMITLAPEQVRPDQITDLSRAGVHVSLGHTGCDYDSARAAFAAGAKGATHLFNAMSGLHHRAPGLVGAALDAAQVIGLIADGHHVHPAAMRVAAMARRDAIYLISDAMAVAGTQAHSFQLDDRKILRDAGRLTLSDGTLAGADLTQSQAVRTYASATGLSIPNALKAAFDTPHRALTGQPNRITIGQPARLLLVRGAEITIFDPGAL